VIDFNEFENLGVEVDIGSAAGEVFGYATWLDSGAVLGVR
jgi:hypothetical protein